MWASWLVERWDDFAAGQEIGVPSYFLHPSVAGFSHETLATDKGQVSNWVRSLEDGSRIHVHEFADGRLVAHRDKIDPNGSVIHAVAHFATETELGRLATLILSVAAIAKLMRNEA